MLFYSISVHIWLSGAHYKNICNLTVLSAQTLCVIILDFNIKKIESIVSRFISLPLKQAA